MDDLEKEILLKKIDQLHNATLNFSKASIQMKQMMITLAAIVAPVVVKLSKDKLNSALFISLYTIIVIFHFLDGFTYYYQRKLRDLMEYHFKLIKDNTINPEIKNKWQKFKFLFKSYYNSSTLIYLFFLIANSIAFILYLNGIIK